MCKNIKAGVNPCRNQSSIVNKSFCNQTISFWESGAREPDLDSLLKISNFFDVSIDSLLGKTDY
ncbi:MAG: helix-turn-helix transcriptional regulator [Clostridia bacterium]|nr:helix-turn-helix transcriptional regulator [Clostridia bacterium]